ncbi:MAG: hypothetical protein ACFFAD_14300 [Candidatus Hermodarchaeota archaeon]
MTKSENKFLDNRMSVEEVDSSQSENNMHFAFAAAVMLAFSVLLPFAYRVDLGPGPDSIRAIIWDYIESSWYSGFRIWNPLDTLPYTLLRLIFAVMLARLYAGKTSPRRTLLVGILAEIQPVLVSAPLVFLVDWPGDGDPLVPLYIPIPIMLAFGILLLLWFRYKRPQ